MGCYGYGRVICCRGAENYYTLRSLRVHGKSIDKYENVRIVLNGRLDTIQAAILLAKLQVFEDELVMRQEIAYKHT